MALFVALIAWALICASNSVHAAGCAHASSTHKQLSAEKGLDPSLMGKWQYVGGHVYYLFHPSPVKCDGPGCRQAPEPGSEMTLIPPTVERSLVPADCHSEALFRPLDHRYTLDLEDRFSTSPVLSGILRPPMA